MESEVRKIDVDAVLRSRLPRHYRYIPRALVKGLASLIHQEDLNRLLGLYGHMQGGEFCHAVLSDLDVHYRVTGPGLPADKRVIIVSNHPLGGLDGIILIDWVVNAYGPDVKFVVNDLLMAIDPLTGVFLPVNKHGRQQRGSGSEIDRWLEGPNPLIVFPAGLVSRRIDNRVMDLEWKKMFVNKAVTSRRDIVPVKFEGRNSRLFYNFAKVRTASGIKLNLEMALLPREVFRCSHRTFTLHTGTPVSWSALRGGTHAAEEAKEIRNTVYGLTH